MFIPLQVLAFATLPAQSRTDGASLFSLFRNIGAAIGVSVTSVDAGAQHAGAARADRRLGDAVQSRAAGRRRGEPCVEPGDRAHGAALLDQMINQQAQIIAYIDDYRMMIFTTCRRCCCCC